MAKTAIITREYDKQLYNNGLVRMPVFQTRPA